MEKRTKILIISASITAAIVVAYIVFKYIQRNSVRKALKAVTSLYNTVSIKKAFDPNRWKTGKPTMTDAQARSFAKKVYDEQHWYGEMEGQMTNALKDIINYDNYSLVAYQYKALYNKDLAMVLEEGLKDCPVCVGILKYNIYRTLKLSKK